MDMKFVTIKPVNQLATNSRVRVVDAILYRNYNKAFPFILARTTHPGQHEGVNSFKRAVWGDAPVKVDTRV